VTRGPHSRSEDRGVDEPEGSSVGRSEDPPANPKTHLGLSSVRRSRRIPARVTGPGPELPVSLLLRVTVPAIRRSGFRLSGPRWSGASGFPHRRDRKSRPCSEPRQIERLIDFREPLIAFRDPYYISEHSCGRVGTRETPKELRPKSRPSRGSLTISPGKRAPGWDGFEETEASPIQNNRSSSFPDLGSPPIR
jgi:hypothetical protein